VEIYQNCIVYNDGAFANFAGKKAAPDAVLWLEAGKPMLFGNGTKGLRFNRDRLALEVVTVANNDPKDLDILVHDETNAVIARLLIDTPFGDFPIALGVIYCDPMSPFDSAIIAQNREASGGKTRDLNALLRRGDTWSVDDATETL
jgi:2-oxoglutarate ferredoxin oxidoreductase subunit beta